MHLSMGSKPIPASVNAESNFWFRCYRNPVLAAYTPGTISEDLATRQHAYLVLARRIG